MVEDSGKLIKVLRSMESPQKERCVDIFQRHDHTHGFEEYRIDAEDGRGWFAIGHHKHRSFLTIAETLESARQVVPWLDGVIGINKSTG